MEVSVIMSEYKTESHRLKMAIDSILNQTFTDFEFIIVNDGDSDYLRRLISEYNEPRVSVIENEKNLGLPASLNKAIEKSSGTYLVRMDTDDIAHPDRIEKLVQYMKDHPQYAVIGSSYNLLTEKGERFPKIFHGRVDRNSFMNRRVPFHPTVIMNKQAVLEVGMYPTKNVRRCEDLVLWAELLLAGKEIFIIEDVLLDYRVELSDYSKRTLKTRKDEIRNRFKYYRKMDADLFQYLSIFKSIAAALMPPKLIAGYHRKYLK